MGRVSGSVLAALWVGWFLYWLLEARNAKPTLRRETALERAFHVGPLIVCAVLLASPSLLPRSLDRGFPPDDLLLRWVGLALTGCGIAFAVWARRHLGGNWSSVVALKAGHALIRSGPYRLVRHPIYAGLLLAILGTVVVIGEWRGLIGLGFALFAIVNRARAEDALMEQTFGEEYREYRRRTPALPPFLK